MKKILLAIGLLIMIELAIVLGMLLVKGGKMIAILEVLGFIVATICTLFGVAYTLAKLNLFWTLNREGEAKAFTCFGAFVGGIVQYQGYRDRVEKGGEVVADPDWKPPWWSRLTGGLKWVGIPPFRKVHEYVFRWATLKMSTEAGKPPEVIIRRERTLDYIFVKPAPYVLEMLNVETKGMVPLNLQIPFLAQCVNMHKALFKIHDWLITVSLLLQIKVKELMASQDFDQLIHDRIRALDELKRGLKGLDISDMLGMIEREFGIEISNLDVSSVEPSRPQDREASLKEWEAQQAAKARVVTAEATKRATVIEAEGGKLATILAAEGQKEAAIRVAEGREKAMEIVSERMGKNKYAPMLAVVDAYNEMAKGGNTIAITGIGGLLNDVSTYLGEKRGALLKQRLEEAGITDEDLKTLKRLLEQKGGTK